MAEPTVTRPCPYGGLGLTGDLRLGWTSAHPMRHARYATMIASSSTYTFYPTIASATSLTAYWVEFHRTRAEARAAVERLAERSAQRPRIVRIQGLDGKPKWQVRWYPKTFTYNVAA